MEYLPLFPLKLVVFEKEELRLHIFEPRYKQLIRECLHEKITFGIAAVVNNKLIGYGTEMKLENVVKSYDGGEMDIVCKALRRFEIKEFNEVQPGKLYPSGMVCFLDYFEDEDKEYKLRLIDLLEELYKVTEAPRAKMPENLDDMTQWVHKCGLSAEQELECAALVQQSERQLYLINHLKTLLASLAQVERMRSLIQANGHFKKVGGDL
jgi:Lon protease-like protein